MASKLFPYTNDFTAGEVSIRFQDRTDVGKYYSAVKRLINFLPFTSGGVTRRPGLNFVADAFCNSGGRILPFKFTRDIDANFTIHLCDLTLDVRDDNGVDVGV